MSDIYNPGRIVITDDKFVDFLRCDLSGHLLDIPGIGKSTLKKLAAGDEPIINAYQLVGKFLSLRNINDTSKSHCDKFLNWLKSKGVNIHCDSIVMSIAEKTNIWVPGIYDCSDFY